MKPAADQLSPFVPTLSLEAGRAVLSVLALGPEVGVELLGSDRGPAVDFRLDLPGRDSITLRLSHPDAPGPVWLAGPHASLSYRSGEDGVDLLTSPPRRESVMAIARRFKAAQRRDGDAQAAALWLAIAEVQRFDGVEDYMYRRVSGGTHGLTGLLRLGFGCNQDCAFCWQDRGWPDAPDARYLGWLEELAEAGVTELSISGGEPTLSKSLPQLIARGAQLGLDVFLQTNAVRLRKRAYAATLREAGLTGLFVSLHSGDAGVSDQMTRAPGTFVGTVAGIEAALAEGLYVTLNCIVESANASGLAQHAEMIVERFVTPFPDNPVRCVSYSNPAAYFDRERFEQSVLPFDALATPLAAAAGILRAAGVGCEMMGACGFPPCVVRGAPWLIRLFDADDLAGLHTMDRDSRAHADVCGTCAIADRCLGPRKPYLERFGGQGLEPFASVPASQPFRMGPEGPS
ncbi:MAG: hypothetical protein ACI9WU_001608 [Myxococcota bacterium]